MPFSLDEQPKCYIVNFYWHTLRTTLILFRAKAEAAFLNPSRFLKPSRTAAMFSGLTSVGYFLRLLIQVVEESVEGCCVQLAMMMMMMMMMMFSHYE